MALFSCREQKALEGFICGFVAEFEGGVVDGEDAGGLGGLCHFPDLLWGCVDVDPGVVGADAEDGEIERAVVAECDRVGGVAGEENFVWYAHFIILEQVAVEAAVAVPRGSSAPVLGLNCVEEDTIILQVLTPFKFGDVAKPLRDELACVCRSNDGSRSACETLERGFVEVIEVCVAEKYQVNWWQVVDSERDR